MSAQSIKSASPKLHSLDAQAVARFKARQQADRDRGDRQVQPGGDHVEGKRLTRGGGGQARAVHHVIQSDQ